MKSIQKVTKVQLNLRHDRDSYFFGIVSSDPDYKLSLQINKKLKINLKSDKPLITSGKEGRKSAFSRFSDIKTGPEKTYHLVSNRHESEYLIRKMKKIDYLFQIFSPDDEINNEDIAASFREITGVTAVFVLSPSDIGREFYSF